MGRRDRTIGTVDRLRGALSGATLRGIIGLRDVGELVLALVRNARGAITDTTGGRDVLVRFVDALTELPSSARLFIPANILWRKPKAGEPLFVLRPSDVQGPDAAWALQGDAGAAGAVPSWFDTKVGLYAPEAVRVESSGSHVELETTGSGKVKLGAAATKAVNREGDPIVPGSLSVVAGAPVPVPPTNTLVPLVFTYTPPSGAPQTITVNITAAGLAVAVVPPGSVTLGGQTGAGSSKVKAED